MQRRRPSCKNSRAVHISPHNHGTVIDSEKSSIKVIRKSTIGFPASHQPTSCVTRNLPKMGFIIQIPKFDVFSTNVDNKPLKVCYKVLLSKKFQRQSCIAINYLSNGMNILAGGDPVPVKFGPKCTDPQQEGCTFHLSRAERCAVDVSRPCSFTSFDRKIR